MIEFAGVSSAAEFREFDRPGFAKTVYQLSARELDPNRTLLSGRKQHGARLNPDE